MNGQKYSYQFKVPSTAIDNLGHVNNVIYLQWCLEVAEKHWISKTDDALRDQYVWVVLNHNISYKNPSFLGEELEIQTWIESYSGVRSTRCYCILRVSDGKTIIEAKTKWALLDGSTRRPIIIPQEIANLFS